MAAADNASSPLPDQLAQRLVRYEDLAPCTTAFVDARTPGSDQKENFTIIGPGVAENPDQHVHITEAHGFNIGGARQPPHCVNSQHSHDTSEVFVIHTGQWAFFTGEDGTDGRVELGPGDIISLPTNTFRGFENIGDVTGFIFAALGGDDPGRVLWAPYVFEAAASHGLVLLANGQLIDTAQGEPVPTDATLMPVTSAADVARLDTYTSEQLELCVMRHSSLVAAAGTQTSSDAYCEQPVIGAMEGGPADATQSADVLSGDGTFELRHIRLQPEASSPTLIQEQPEVLLMQSGELTVDVDGASLTLRAGDVFTVPVGMRRRLHNGTRSTCEAYSVHGTDASQVTPNKLPESL